MDKSQLKEYVQYNILGIYLKFEVTPWNRVNI